MGEPLKLLILEDYSKISPKLHAVVSIVPFFSPGSSERFHFQDPTENNLSSIDQVQDQLEQPQPHPCIGLQVWFGLVQFGFLVCDGMLEPVSALKTVRWLDMIRDFED